MSDVGFSFAGPFMLRAYQYDYDTWPSPCLPAYGCVFVACLMACMLLVKLFMNYLCDHVFFKGPPGEDLELRHFLVLV